MASVRGQWDLPSRRLQASRCWEDYGVAVFDRGEGAGLWRASQHRLLVSLTRRPPMEVRINGGAVHRLAPVPDAVSLLPADSTLRTEAGDSRYVQVCWDPHLYGKIAPGRADPPRLKAVATQDPLLWQLARTLAGEIEDRTIDRLLADSLMAAIALRVAQRFAQGHVEEQPAVLPARIQRAVEYLEENLGSQVTLVELAGVACLSPFHFSRCFKRTLGVGPHRYLRQRRIARAKEMIARSKQPLAAIAQAVGFMDQSHFTAAFRLETGTTPGRFRAASR